MPDRESICESHLVQGCKRLGMPVPNPRYRGNNQTRALARMHEVLVRWDGKDPSSYHELTRWFKGQNDVVGKPAGAKVWLDLCRHCGLDPIPYDEIPNGSGTSAGKLKLSIEHWFKQCMAGDRDVYVRGLAFLDALEFGLNNSAEFKHFDSLAQEAMIGSKATLVRRRQIEWTNTGENYKLPSFYFFQSAKFTADLDITPIIYLSSGQRATGMTRQVTLPFSPANFTRSALNSSLATAESIAASSEPLVIELCTKATQTETSVLEKRGREEFEAMAKELEAKDRELEELRAFKRAHEAKSESSDDDDDDDDEEPAPKRAKSDDAKKRSPFAGVTFHTRENKWEVRAPMRGIERVGESTFRAFQERKRSCLGYFTSQKEAESKSYQHEQNALGKEWCEVDSRIPKHLEYIPWCRGDRAQLVPPKGWIPGKVYATITFGTKYAGPAIVTLCKHRPNKDGVQGYKAQLTKAFRKLVAETAPTQSAQPQEPTP